MNPKYNLFLDSIVIQLKNGKSVSLYKEVVRFLSMHFQYVKMQDIPSDKRAKFYNAYISRDFSTNNKCLCGFCFDKEIKGYNWFIVYARKEGVYVELHGIVQYHNSYTQEKLQAMHLLFKEYNSFFSFSKIDVAIDVRDKFSRFMLYSSKSNNVVPVDTYYTISSSRCYYYNETNKIRNRQSRLVKAYDKTYQRHRKYVLPFYLTRIEVTIRRTKLKNIATMKDFYDRVAKELSYYRFFFDNQELSIDNKYVELLVQDLFQVLHNGKNIKFYSNIYKNHQSISNKSSLAYDCYVNNHNPIKYVKNNDISINTLRKYKKIYKEYDNE